jgi:hypothetical protein
MLTAQLRANKIKRRKKLEVIKKQNCGYCNCIISDDCYDCFTCIAGC